MEKIISIGLIILCLICVTGSITEESGIIRYAMPAGSTPKLTPVIPEGSEQNDETSAACQETLEEFLYLWNIRSLDRMLEYCSAGWKAQQTNPMLRLFAILGTRNPLSYTLYEINLQKDDAYADLVILIDRNNGKDPVNYRFSIHLVREDGWYLDPESLENYSKVEE